MSEDITLPETLEKEEKLIEISREIFDKLREEEGRGLVYAVMGGIAVLASSQNINSPHRDNGSVRDIDVMVLEDTSGGVARIRSWMEEKGYGNRKNLPRLSLKVARPEEYHSPFQLVSMVKHAHGKYALVFRDIETTIPEGVLRTVNAQLNTNFGPLRFKSFTLQTILHLYIIPIASLRPKDMPKLRALAREAAKITPDEGSQSHHDAYRVFHDFAREVREKYPHHAAAIKIFDAIDTTLFNATGSHTLPTSLFRKLIDL